MEQARIFYNMVERYTIKYHGISTIIKQGHENVSYIHIYL